MSLELHDITIKIPVCFPLGESINVMSRDLEAYLAVWRGWAAFLALLLVLFER